MRHPHNSISRVAIGLLLMLAVPQAARAERFSFIAVLNSGQEMQTPKPDSNAQGVALMTLDNTTRKLCYAISYSPLAGRETAAHFHGPASAGQSAGVLFPITPTGSPKTGCVGPLKGKDAANLKKGLFYINVHSDVFPSGELRGQVFRMISAQTDGDVASE